MRLALVGVGRMGRAVEELAPAMGHEVVAWLDSASHADGLGMTAMLAAQADVAIDFSRGDGVPANVEAATGVGLDVVVGTTGWYQALDKVTETVRRAEKGLIYAPNFSVGMHAFTELVRTAARLADPLDEYDVALSESHHRGKADHPSGTALRLVDVLIAALARKERWSASLPPGPVDPATLHVSVSRSGSEPGTHTVILDGPDDRIELTHRARGRAAFARGALAAAEWIQDRKGVFTLDDMMADLRRSGNG